MTSTVQELLTPEQAAEWITTATGVRVSRAWVLSRIPHELPAINWSGGTGRGIRWRIDPAELDEWLKERHRAA